MRFVNSVMFSVSLAVSLPGVQDFFPGKEELPPTVFFFFYAQLKPFVIWSEAKRHLTALAQASSLQKQLLAETAAAPHAPPEDA